MSKISELSDGGSLVSSDYLIAVRSGGNVKVRMDQINVDQVDLGDNEFIRLGNSQDLTMVHNATNSIINQAGIGDLLIQKAGSTKLTINASGINVTGSVTASGNIIPTGGSATAGSIWKSGANLLISMDTGGLYVNNSADTITALQITDAGNVGIGVSPLSTAKLDINISTNARGYFASNIGEVGAGNFALQVADATGTNLKPLGFRAEDIRFATQGGERMRIDSSGRVGIGVVPSTVWSSSYDALQIGLGGSVYAHGSAGSNMQMAANVVYEGLSPNFYDKYLTSSTASKYVQDSGIHIWSTAASGTAGNNITWSESMRIDSNGNVGIGTSSPNGNGILTLNTPADNSAQIVFAENDTAKWLIGHRHDGDYFRFYDLANSAERMRIDASGDTFFGISSKADVPTNGGVYIAGDNSVGSSNSYAQVFVVHNSSTNHGIIIKELNASGEAIQFLNSSATIVGSISTGASATAYNTSSDYRLKENVVAMSGATERLKQLKPSRFNFIADADTTVDGFLAHEVQDIVPEAITGTKDAMRDEEYEVTPAVLDDDGNVITEAVMGTRSVPDYQGIDQSKLVPLLVATIQELEARIAALES